MQKCKGYVSSYSAATVVKHCRSYSIQRDYIIHLNSTDGLASSTARLKNCNINKSKIRHVLLCTCRVALHTFPSASTPISPTSCSVTSVMVSEWLVPPCAILYLGPATTATLLNSHFKVTSAGVTEHLKMASLPSFATTLFNLDTNFTKCGAVTEQIVYVSHTYKNMQVQMLYKYPSNCTICLLGTDYMLYLSHAMLNNLRIKQRYRGFAHLQW